MRHFSFSVLTTGSAFALLAGCGERSKFSAVGNTVALTTAKYTNTIRAPMLMGSWTDHEWKPGETLFTMAESSKSRRRAGALMTR